jgi:hypothetical protein
MYIEVIPNEFRIHYENIYALILAIFSTGAAWGSYNYGEVENEGVLI